MFNIDTHENVISDGEEHIKKSNNNLLRNVAQHVMIIYIFC